MLDDIFVNLLEKQPQIMGVIILGPENRSHIESK